MVGDLVMMERSNLDNFTLGPFTINSEQYARQLVNLSEFEIKFCATGTRHP